MGITGLASAYRFIGEQGLSIASYKEDEIGYLKGLASYFLEIFPVEVRREAATKVKEFVRERVWRVENEDLAVVVLRDVSPDATGRLLLGIAPKTPEAMHNLESLAVC